jgi:hypothetical protein
MSAYSKNEKNVSLDARVPYAPPALTIVGKVEQLTAIGFRGPRDLLHFRNLL